CTAVCNERALGHALNQLELRQLYDPTGLQVLMERHRGRRGIAKLRGLAPDPTVVHEGFEERFRAEAEWREWPAPKYNEPLAVPGWYGLIDVLWEDRRLAVELDSRSSHLSMAQFEEDHRRDRALRRGGYLPLRITWAQYYEGVEEVDELLGASPRPGGRPRHRAR
ncbi:MAG: hypothetical protein H0V29_01725, partial [Thermoleophilaceae bacterium]|nr:hypothetical protein [Thermoleophilaceae bacterium]